MKLLFKTLYYLTIITLLVSIILRIWIEDYRFILNKIILTSIFFFGFLVLISLSVFISKQLK